MAEKTDEEIIKEVGLDSSEGNDISTEEALAELSITDDDSLEPVTEEQELETPTSSENEDSKPTEDNSSINSKVIENEDKDDEKDLASQAKNKDEELPVQKKQPKIYKILIGIAAFLFLIIITGAILYFTGFFDPEPVKPVEKKIEVKMKPEIEFDEKNLDKTKLNKKLTMLTKTEIMNKEELEAEEKKIKEEERKKKEAEEKLIADKKKQEEEKQAAQLAKIEEEKRLLKEHQDAIKKEQEDFIKMQKEAALELEAKKAELLKEIENKKTMPTNIPTMIPEEMEENEDMIIEETGEEIVEQQVNNSNVFLNFINVATIKGELFKSFLDKVLTIDKNLSLCRDSKNRIEIYFGPYDSKIERNKVFDNLVENGFKESYLVDFTKEEYEKRCKY